MESAIHPTHPWVTIGCTQDTPELPGAFHLFGGQCGRAAVIPDLITVLVILLITVLFTIHMHTIPMHGTIPGITGLFTGIRDIMVVLIGIITITRTTIITTIPAEAEETPEVAG